jgi:sulfur carrier protein ThiS
MNKQNEQPENNGSEISVQVASVGGSSRSLHARGGITLGDLLKQAGINPTGHDIRVNGPAASLDHVLEDGDVVTIIPKIRGGR